MNAAAFDHITDIDELREAMRAELARRDAEIAKRDAEIDRRDAVIAQHDTILGKRDREIRLQSARIEQLAQVIAKFQRMQFAARSEKFDPTQQALFDDAFGADLGAPRLNWMCCARRRANARSPSVSRCRRIAWTTSTSAAWMRCVKRCQSDSLCRRDYCTTITIGIRCAATTGATG